MEFALLLLCRLMLTNNDVASDLDGSISPYRHVINELTIRIGFVKFSIVVFSPISIVIT